MKVKYLSGYLQSNDLFITDLRSVKSSVCVGEIILLFFTLSRYICIFKAEYFNKDTHNTVLYFLDYGQDKEKQNDFNDRHNFILLKSNE